MRIQAGYYDVYDNGCGEHLARRKLLTKFDSISQMEAYRKRLEERLIKIYNKEHITVMIMHGDDGIENSSWFKRMCVDLDKALSDVNKKI